MILQRLHGGAPLELAVLELLRGLPEAFWPQPCKRVRQWRQQGIAPSSNTGAYNQARQMLPVSVVEKSCDRMFTELVVRTERSTPEQGPRAFILDGSSMRLPHSPELCEVYPPGSNQHGENHFPLIRVLVAHDLHTGLAMRPVWGPMYGPDAVSEQGLLEQAIGRLPNGSTVIGDANFGIFSVAWTGTQKGHPVLLRLTLERAQRLAGKQLRDGADSEVKWKPSRLDRRSHPELPADAFIKGRLMVRQVMPGNGEKPLLLALFTTLPLSQQDVYEIYGQRWNIETDLRTLKSTLQLDQLTCTTADMVAREIDLSMAAYNLVRSLIALAAEQSGIRPRDYSFTRVRRIVQVFAPALAAAPDSDAASRIFDQIMKYVHQAKLPRRKRKRSAYPRAVWPRKQPFPNRKLTEAQK